MQSVAADHPCNTWCFSHTRRLLYHTSLFFARDFRKIVLVFLHKVQVDRSGCLWYNLGKLQFIELGSINCECTMHNAQCTMNEVFSLMRKDILSFAEGKTLQQFCILPSAFCIQIAVYRAQPVKLQFVSLIRQNIPYTSPSEGCRGRDTRGAR